MVKLKHDIIIIFVSYNVSAISFAVLYNYILIANSNTKRLRNSNEKGNVALNIFTFFRVIFCS